MLQSKLFAKSKKSVSAEAQTISQQLLLRADFIEQSFAGVYRFLPLGFKVLKNIEAIVRQEMEALGGQEVCLAALQSKALWEETGRWETFDPPLFKFKDRHEKEIGLGSTHEEEIVDIFRHRIKSYQDLPLALFQIQTKFRNEMRPSGGLMRTREFLMKDLYSFHAEEKEAAAFYEKVKASYFRIFKKCGLNPLCVQADSGTIGGSESNEFMVVSEIGEDRILVCAKCGFSANIEKIGEVKKCPQCGMDLAEKRAVEIGHIFKLGDKYSKVMKADFTDKAGQSHPVIMGCYGIGLPRLMAMVVESNHDEKGIIWPKTVSPFAIHLVPIEANARVKKAADKIYQELQKEGLNVLYDDREGKTAGEKFAEADLLGTPWRIVVSERSLKNNSAEIKERKRKEAVLVSLSRVKTYFKKLC
jgi:prolyl-tRNA synthetase